MNAQKLMQDRIDIEQWLADVEYGLRSLKVCGGAWYCTGVHAAQLATARAAAAEFGVAIDRNTNGGAAVGLCGVRDELKALLKDVKAELKAIGGIRQLRMALAAGDGHDFELAA